MTIEERLARLERKCRRLTVTLVFAGGTIAMLAVLAVAVGMAPAGAAPREAIEAGKFILVDPQGMRRATLSLSEQGPGLWLFDQNGTYRAGLGINSGGVGLMLRDAKGQNRAVLGVAEKGPELTLCDPVGKPVWGYDENGQPIGGKP